MIHYPRALILGGLMVMSSAGAAYAPLPEPDSGRDLTVSVRTGAAYDTNIFGAATGTVGSAVWTVAPRAAYTVSVTDQTFLSATYGLTLDYLTRRPGDKLLDSHDASVRAAHAFSKVTMIDVSDAFAIARNPEALLAGVPVNAEQTYTRNQLDGRFVTPATAKSALTLKARSVYYDYHNASLGRSLNRTENLAGLAADYAVLPELKAVAEYRRQQVGYRSDAALKNKGSDFLMAGVDYELARRFAVSGRLGGEGRQRRGERDTQSPYAEFSGKFDYARKSYLAGGYAYTLEESSDTLRFTDTRVNRFFVTLEHAVTGRITTSGSVTWEPAKLQGRRGVRDIAETTTRAGVALSYSPTRRWTLALTLDHDDVRSDDQSRRLRRTRTALNATCTF